MASVCNLCNISCCFVGNVGSGDRFWVFNFFFFSGIEASLIIDVLYSSIVYRLPISDLPCQDICPEDS